MASSAGLDDGPLVDVTPRRGPVAAVDRLLGPGRPADQRRPDLLKLHGAKPMQHLSIEPTEMADDHSLHPGAARARPVSRPALVRMLVAGLILAAVVVALLAADPGKVSRGPLVFGLLVASFVILDVLRIDLFERAHVSPASVPVLALAFVFGPFGPLAAETALAVKRAVQRDPVTKWAFDLGSLALAGMAAALVFGVLPHGRPAFTLLAALAAALVYYLVNAVTLSVVMALHEGDSIVAIWRERLAWLAVHYVGFGLTAGAFVVIERDHGAYAVLFFAIPLLVLFAAEQQYVDRARESVSELRKHRDELAAANTRLGSALATNQDLMRSMQRSYLSTITSLARTIEAKDPYTGGHTERVRDFAMLLARELGLSEEDLRAIEVGSIIHDIGKIGIPDGILTKPGQLTEEEFDAMRRHPEISSYIVSELELPLIVKQMVRSHHERWDGRGYPDGLAGEDIPLAARILAVADTLDAMTSDRSYRQALPVEAAIEEIRNLSGAQFCPRVAATFLACHERDPSLGGAFASQSSSRA